MTLQNNVLHKSVKKVSLYVLYNEKHIVNLSLKLHSALSYSVLFLYIVDIFPFRCIAHLQNQFIEPLCDYKIITETKLQNAHSVPAKSLWLWYARWTNKIFFKHTACIVHP